MSTVEQYLNKIRDSIECSACGNCCEGIVEPCIQLRPDRLCNIHPKLVGGRDCRAEIIKSCDPETDPVAAGKMGYFCPPLASKILELTGIELLPTEIWNSGLIGSIPKSEIRAVLDKGQSKKTYFDYELFNAAVEQVLGS